MTIEKTLLAATGVLLAGVVGYKIIKKKNPEFIKNTKETMSNITSAPVEFLKGARESFREGYASA